MCNNLKGILSDTDAKHANGSKDAKEVIPGDEITISIPDACRRSGLKRSFLYLEMKDGRIPYIIRGKRRLLPLDGLRRYLSDSS
jgi:hypothetical protein